ncbi:hypothetical protein [Oceanobacillus sp. FSL K6-0127]|uniref:hypothetical protein n=1 Tax=Oceanobacillus sp. FSL K6-0127 TaxID=2921420 RepID=UPI0030EBF58B
MKLVFIVLIILHLCFHRLSIIDLERGQQPFLFGDDRYRMVFNGEIYNYVQLREELVEIFILTLILELSLICLWKRVQNFSTC